MLLLTIVVYICLPALPPPSPVLLVVWTSLQCSVLHRARPAPPLHYRSSSDCSVQLSVSQSVSQSTAAASEATTQTSVLSSRLWTQRYRNTEILRGAGCEQSRKDDKNTGEESEK